MSSLELKPAQPPQSLQHSLPPSQPVYPALQEIAAVTTAQHGLPAALDQQLELLMQQGELRRLGVAFTRFVAQLGTADPVLLLSCVVLSELEGRGHSCLRIPDLLSDPDALLGWPTGQWQALQNSAGPLPATSRLWLRQLAACSQVLLEAELDHGQPLLLVDDRLYLRRYWNYECAVASAVQRKASQPRSLDLQQVRQGLDTLFGVAKNTDAAQTVDWQRIACAIAVRSHFSIITGGPGTGKTYTVARLLALLFSLSAQAEQLRIVLAAPTGKAAARLKQAIDHALSGLAEKMQGQLPLTELAARMAPAATLHSLLGARPDTRRFRHHAGNPLDVDVLIVDEASMVHLEMMAAILDALPPHAMLILLGDKDQLASVEAGAVLGDLCHNASAGAYLPETAAYVQAASGQQLPAAMLHGQSALAQQTVMLRESRRFGGPIGQLALTVNAGQVAASSHLLQTDNSGMLSWYAQVQLPALLQLALAGRAGVEDSYLPYLQLLQAAPVLQPDAAEDGAESSADAGNEADYLAWVKQVLLAFDRFRILCAVREGEWGVAGVNALIEQALMTQRWIQKRSDWYAGRPVMITRNDYGLGVFNGDIGMTLPDPRRPDSLRVYFLQGEQVRSVLATRLVDVETAFAMTVHKSQGSEFSHVALVLPEQGGNLLARELLYTGITRARQFFTLLTPQPGVFADALQRQTKRVSGLQELLK
ncbi:exodeoxyribonuclease V subunit alpha [Undibacterium rugosum]|uniref:exodeoxyribonuclease V subunit alpha n=1 Tax=Undibacterium rugosum TaxID=2762291 RepID=UPI001E34C24D|nr:exodeoxyribonuclease V subunit alpha [Undibacterium rugosum]